MKGAESLMREAERGPSQDRDQADWLNLGCVAPHAIGLIEISIPCRNSNSLPRVGLYFKSRLKAS
jgi:hypothetical protein